MSMRRERNVQRMTVVILITLMLCLAVYGMAGASLMPGKPKIAETPENVEKGRTIYFKRCSFCHGLLGDGNGPVANYLDPRPRDFTLGIFKFRTTESGELPLDSDLFRTVSMGLRGTAMQGFDDEIIKNGLTEEERWQVIYYIKTLAPEFSNPDFDPRDKVVKLPPNMPGYSSETIAKGEELFIKAKCWECHGKGGRGDGLKSLDRKDDWGFPIRIRNITQPWKIKAGLEVEDIYMRFSTGIIGTPMPSFAKSFTDEERWYLASFIKSLQHEPTSHVVMKAKLIEGDLPDGPDSDQWTVAEPMDVRLAGQVIAAPRWQNPAIDMVHMKALYNKNELAILLEWDDPFQDITHDESKEYNTKQITKVGAYNSYIAANDMIPRNLNNYRDSIAVQFPAKTVVGTRKPHFFRGNTGDLVNLWVWKADLHAAKKPAIEDSLARGYRQPIKKQSDEEQQVVSKALWEAGRWKVMMKRPLTTGDKNDVQLVPGTFIPIALNAWDGSNGEHGLIMSLSSWHYLLLEAAPPTNVYIYTLLGVLLAGLGEFWYVRKVRRDN